MKDGRTGDDHCNPDITQYSIGCDDSTDILKCKCDSPYTWNYDKEICDYKISCKTDLMKDGKTGDEHCKPEYTKYSIGCDDSTGVLLCKCVSPYSWDYEKEICSYKISCKTNKMKDGKTGDEHCRPEITKYSKGCDDSTGVLKCKCDSPYIWDYDKEICAISHQLSCDKDLIKTVIGKKYCNSDKYIKHFTGQCLVNTDTNQLECKCVKGFDWNKQLSTCDYHQLNCKRDLIKEVIGDTYCNTDKYNKHFTGECVVSDDKKELECKCDTGFEWNKAISGCEVHEWDCKKDLIKTIIGVEYCKKDKETKHFTGECVVSKDKIHLECKCDRLFEWNKETLACDKPK
ncbi:uncharacterized protein LOC128955408 [Oppia nitens]|uniref:uncharacterized protein LOC128955408 n=1 Tax=Oppia nitens TaxID=1686743 RepID=UPI0023D98AED|nr:uncharacterized protein LOC128955408 [Oppia nitens]